MPLWRDRQRPPYPEVTGVNCLVPSTWFPQAPWYTLPVHLCRFRVRSIRWSYFLEPLDLRRKRLSRFLSLLMSAFSLPIPPEALTGLPSQAYGTLRYHSFESAASVHGLSPGTSSAQAGLIRPVSYYAFFKGWLLLSQPPGCFGLPTSFPT